MPEDPTIYVTNSSVTDPRDAPSGSSNLFILVNAPSVHGEQNWKEISESYPRKVFEKLEKSGLYGLHQHLQFYKILDPVHFKRSEEHTSELQSRGHLVCRLLLEKKT